MMERNPSWTDNKAKTNFQEKRETLYPAAKFSANIIWLPKNLFVLCMSIIVVYFCLILIRCNRVLYKYAQGKLEHY